MCAQILALIEVPENGHQVLESLKLSKHNIEVLSTFAKAMEVLRNNPVDLVISDVHLENGGSVFDFLIWVKRTPTTKEIPFVLFSHQPTPLAKYLADGVRTTARLLGATKYITMDSFNSIDFCAQIDSLLPEKDEATKANLLTQAKPGKENSE